MDEQLGIKIVLVCFAAFALVRVLQRFRRGGLSTWQLLTWVTLWTGLAVVALLPDMTVRIAELLGVGRGVDVAIYVSLALLFYVAFRQFGKLEDLERQITRLVRANALAEFERPQRPSGPPPAR